MLSMVSHTEHLHTKRMHAHTHARMHAHTHTHNRFMDRFDFVHDYPGESARER